MPYAATSIQGVLKTDNEHWRDLTEASITYYVVTSPDLPGIEQ